ncbi:MAG: GNAT family N-acetyltransferase [Pseudomonadota bacterium]
MNAESPTFDFQPTLNDDTVTLRSLSNEDFESLYAVAADPAIWAQHPVRNRHDLAVFQSFFDESLNSGGALVVIDNATGEVIGSSRFHGYDQTKREVEIGWSFLARSHWGGAYNKQMKQLMLEHAFRFVDQVVFPIAIGNIRSQRAIEKIGAIKSENRPDAGGNPSFVYRIDADSYDLCKTSST